MRSLNIRIIAISLLVPILVFLLLALSAVSANAGTFTDTGIMMPYGVTVDNPGGDPSGSRHFLNLEWPEVL